jgi:thiamine-phosphate pyrophosphorylase
LYPLYPILDTAILSLRGITPEAAASGLLAAGARILQFRHKGHFSREMFETARRVGDLCRSSGCRYVIDDRSDIALLLGAGVHLGQDDLPPAVVRSMMGPEAFLGFSTHNESQLCAGDAESVDYLALGPIFATASKANPDPTVGIEELRRLRPLTTKPLVAIGGITRQNARSVLHAGANSVAVISDLFPENGAEHEIRKRTEEWLAVLQ